MALFNAVGKTLFSFDSGKTKRGNYNYLMIKESKN